MGHTKNLPDLIKFLYAAGFRPVQSTCISKIITGYFQSWPGITEEVVHKNLPKSPAIEMGNLNKKRKNKISTQPTPDTSTDKY